MTKINMKITHLKCHWNLQWVNVLIKLGNIGVWGMVNIIPTKFNFMGIRWTLALLLWKIATSAGDNVVIENDMKIIKRWDNNAAMFKSAVHVPLLGIMKWFRNLNISCNITVCIACGQSTLMLLSSWWLQYRSYHRNIYLMKQRKCWHLACQIFSDALLCSCTIIQTTCETLFLIEIFRMKCLIFI